MLTCTYVIANIHERDRVIVMLLGRLELGRSFLRMLVACVEMGACPVRQFGTRPADHLLQIAFGFLKLVFLHGAQSSLVVLHSLCKTWIVGQRLLRLGCLG